MACVPTLALLLLVNFQGNVLDNAGANAFPPSANNPIIGQSLNSPIADSLNQQWRFIPQAGNSSYIIANGISGGNAAFVSYPAAGNPGPFDALFAQAVTQLNQSQALVFEVECTGSTTGIIIETLGGNVLTAWPTEAGSTTSPVTYDCSQNFMTSRNFDPGPSI
ncbi:hypothetical protein C8R44DRAFT_989677 [Mycena epipterygia]|nr:hypothetical protein C8R44DRAFT_989677 [Mycena epipterygia]